MNRYNDRENSTKRLAFHILWHHSQNKSCAFGMISFINVRMHYVCNSQNSFIESEEGKFHFLPVVQIFKRESKEFPKT